MQRGRSKNKVYIQEIDTGGARMSRSVEDVFDYCLVTFMGT